MKTNITLLLAAGLVAGCASSAPETQSHRAESPRRLADRVDATSDGTSTAANLDGYKRDLAHRICEVNASKVYVGRPQALLRSVIVVKYAIGAGGELVHSDIVRSNRDRDNETTALSSLRSTAPFPKPAQHLLRGGRIDVTETWLFNNDGRFQLRTIAQPQLAE
jgi:protein TonB